MADTRVDISKGYVHDEVLNYMDYILVVLLPRCTDAYTDERIDRSILLLTLISELLLLLRSLTIVVVKVDLHFGHVIRCNERVACLILSVRYALTPPFFRSFTLALTLKHRKER